MDTCTDCNILGQIRGVIAVLLQLLQYCYITLLWILGIIGMLLVQGRGKWRFCLPLLQYSYIEVQCIHGLNAMILKHVIGE